MQKVEDFRKEVELRRRLERNQERFVRTQSFADGCPSLGADYDCIVVLDGMLWESFEELCHQNATSGDFLSFVSFKTNTAWVLPFTEFQTEKIIETQ